MLCSNVTRDSVTPWVPELLRYENVFPDDTTTLLAKWTTSSLNFSLFDISSLMNLAYFGMFVNNSTKEMFTWIFFMSSKNLSNCLVLANLALEIGENGGGGLKS